ncbi:MAG TPA: cytidylate kinase-like family protein [Anaerolineae bacterium]|nr:cytidylate kinase-like family protein [Anaerolineae bacterium]HQK13112.1 cytidylate kinase-like family protein [Anaerolineae bacterium]
MAVITISRELGSNGDLIADRLCEQLGYRRVDKAIVMQIAQEAGVDVETILQKEQDVTQRARLVSGEMTSLYRKQASAFEKKAALDDQTYAQVVRETLERFAREDNVIIMGRGGQMVLSAWPKALHVRLYAPLEVRVQRLMEREQLTQAEAERRVEQSDEQKRQYIRYWHNNADWRNPKYYHLSIDTARFSPETIVQMIILAARDIDKTG